MCNIMYKFLFCIVFVSVCSFGKNVIISGNYIVTVLVISEGKDPFLALSPVESCNVTIFAGCSEETKDQYFARTDKNGHYSVELNLPEECTYQSLVISSEAVIKTDTVANSLIIINADSLPDTLRADLHTCSDAKNDTTTIQRYMYGIHTIAPSLLFSGDSVMVYCTLKAIADGTDTLHFLSDYKISVYLVTSSGDTVSNENYQYEPNRSLYLEKNFFQMYNIFAHIPKDLQKTYSDFARDRKLSLIIRFNDDSKISDIVSFQVIDKGIRIQQLTSTRNQSGMQRKSSSIKLSIKSTVVHVFIPESGIYSIDLFSIDGRLLQKIIQNKHLNAGEHTFDIKSMRPSSSKAIIARVNKGKIATTSFINLL